MLTVGQKLWYVGESRYGHLVAPTYWVVVTKVGRLWASIKSESPQLDERIDLATLRVDGKGNRSPGRCFYSEDQYQRHILDERYWRAFCAVVYRHYTRSAVAGSAEISQAAGLLGLREALGEAMEDQK